MTQATNIAISVLQQLSPEELEAIRHYIGQLPPANDNSNKATTKKKRRSKRITKADKLRMRNEFLKDFKYRKPAKNTGTQVKYSLTVP